ncbi:MAG: haloacid dehalogenase type II [Abyssibacter sp.]|uniref:haloacid dehalogenase type II n=1 Tax=Abyssibacter sp. TaxID=2320200 RepID=UPI00321AC65B
MRLFVLLCSLFFVTVSLAEPTHSSPLIERPKVLFFDVNETLLDLAPMRESVGQALEGREELLPLWFSTMLHHSLVDSATKRYHDFGTIGVAALMMVAESNGIAMTEQAARQAIVTPLRSLPPHPDVKAGLQALKDAGFTLVSLTNSSRKGVATQFKNAGLTYFFERQLSVEDIRLYKPNLGAFEWALEQMGIQPEEGMLVAAHGWDVAGARAAGMQAAFVSRPGKTLYPLAIEPTLIVPDIQALADQLTAD